MATAVRVNAWGRSYQTSQGSDLSAKRRLERTGERGPPSCHRFVANQVHLALFVLAYTPGNFLRRLALPESIRHWSLRSIQVKLIKIGAKVVRHARQVIFQIAEVAVSKELFVQILERIWALAPGAG